MHRFAFFLVSNLSELQSLSPLYSLQLPWHIAVLFFL
jgi:hypothetical protein